MPLVGRLQTSLEALLREPDKVEFVTAVADADRNVYVQFAPVADMFADRLRIPRGTLVGNATGEAYLTPAGQMTPVQHDRLIALGWLADDDGTQAGGNFWRYWHPPVDPGAIALVGIGALIDGYGIAAPPELQIRGADRTF